MLKEPKQRSKEVSPTTAEGGSSVTTSISSVSIPEQEIQSSSRLKRLSRLQRDAMGAGGVTD